MLPVKWILGSIWMVNANIPSLMILPSFKFKTYLVFAFTTQIDPILGKRNPAYASKDSYSYGYISFHRGYIRLHP
jgi:meiotically up-regulated gene 157 (Mug157) protein